MTEASGAAASPEKPSGGALALLRQSDFRRLWLAIAASELGDALHYIALMWFALVSGGTLGVVAVRLADSVPAILFGLHGGVVADRWSPRRILITADLVRGAVLVPVALLGLAHRLPLWGLVVAAFVLETATSYFAPAYGVMLPAVAGRENVQAANGLVRATASAVSVGGWALAAVLVSVMPMTAFFAMNALSFFVSAALVSGLAKAEKGREPARQESSGHRSERNSRSSHLSERNSRSSVGAEIREGFAAVRRLGGLTAGVVGLGVGVTIATGSWIGGVPELVRTGLDAGASGFSIVMVGYAVGSIIGGLVLARRNVRDKAAASLFAWAFGAPAFVLLARSTTLTTAVLGALAAGIAQTSAVILLNSAAQAQAPTHVLGRVTGLISLVHRGAHATALLFVSPLYALFPPRRVFVGAAVALAAIGLGGAAWARRAVPSVEPHRSG